jgi:hypothetical protein
VTSASADVAALNLGLERLAGEDNASFVERLYRAARSQRDGTYRGLLNEISLELGLQRQAAIRVDSSDPLAAIAVRGPQLTLTASGRSTSILLASLDEDQCWCGEA